MTWQSSNPGRLARAIVFFDSLLYLDSVRPEHRLRINGSEHDLVAQASFADRIRDKMRFKRGRRALPKWRQRPAHEEHLGFHVIFGLSRQREFELERFLVDRQLEACD